MRAHQLVLVLALALLLHSAAAFFEHAHDCGDTDTRNHILKGCRNALWKLDSLIPPSLAEAIDHHNIRNFNAALNSPTLKAARKDANQCAMCILHGFSNCDVQIHDSGCGTPGLVHEHAYGLTDLSQNCKDHVLKRNKLKAGFGPAFRMHEVHIEGSHVLKAQPAAVEWQQDFIFAETAPVKTTDDNTVTTYNGPAGLLNDEQPDSVGNAQDDPTLLDDYKVSNIDADRDAREAAARDQTTAKPVTEEAAQMPAQDLKELPPPFYICALVNDTKQVDLTCPPGMKISEITYASYGTPIWRLIETVEQKLNDSQIDPSILASIAGALKNTKLQNNGNADLALAETAAKATAPIVQQAITAAKELTQNGYVLFSGPKCYEAAFQTRDECSAYNSRDVVEFACKGSSKCTLRATGDPKVFPNTFQYLTCDAQLQLYVKAACVSAEAMAAAEAQSTSDLIRNYNIEVQKEVLLDFNDPNQMDFLPGVLGKEDVSAISREEDKFANYKDKDGAIQRPIVREQIDPPSDYFPNFILTGSGQSSFRCEDSGMRDADGNIYIWRPNGAEPRNTWMRFYDEENRMVAEWDQESNTYKWLSDGSTTVPEAFPVGEVTDTGVTDGVQNHFENAPDNLYHMQTGTGNGMFSGIKYIQRYQSRQGVPPKEDGIVVLTGNKQWFRCKNGQNLQERIVPMTGTYFFYTQDAHYAEKGRGAPFWVWIIVGVGAALFVTLIAGAVYWKVKGAPKFISRKKAYEGSYDKTSDAANRLQRTLLYGEEEGEGTDMMAQTEAL